MIKLLVGIYDDQRREGMFKQSREVTNSAAEDSQFDLVKWALDAMVEQIILDYNEEGDKK